MGFCSRRKRRLDNSRAGKADVTRGDNARRLACFLAAGWGVGPGWDVSDGRRPKRLRAMRGGRSDDDVASSKSPTEPDAMQCDASHHNTVVDGEKKRHCRLERAGRGRGPSEN